MQFDATFWTGVVVNSLSISSVLILAALGLAITFGVMRVINMAHGHMMMLGAYTGVVIMHLMEDYHQDIIRVAGSLGIEMTLQNCLDLTLYIAIPLSFILVGLVGYCIETGLIRFLYGRPLDTLLATWGVGIIVQQIVNLTVGRNNESLIWPKFMTNHSISVFNVTIGYYRFFVILVTLVCLLGVYALFFRTSFGLKIRAVVQNRKMAAALGISTRRVDAFCFAVATGLAGVAGCIIGFLYAVEPTMGDKYIVESFMVVILGGLGQLMGTVGGGLLYGTAFSFVEKVNGNYTIARSIILFVVVVVLLIRPAGLFATRERSYES